jgi:hypothetical protein
MFKFENRVRKVMAEVLEPITAIQKDHVHLIESNREMWLKLD